ncbi:hypothetical protein AB0I30_24395 [Nocardia tengchongensis]|uniref:hypothetical protein n=1 Tax=Nocardia tengchongensis TaxID=2055889 RepID=UPI0033C0D1E6
MLHGGEPSGTADTATIYWPQAIACTSSIGASVLRPEGNEAFSKSGELRKRYVEWLPEIPLARSPFTDELTTWPIDTVDLDGWFWNWSNPICRRKSEVPADWLAMGGAMRLVEPLAPQPFDFCMPGPDVPYVVPRLLDLPDTRAVLAQVGIGHHTGWTITTSQPTDPTDFHLKTFGAVKNTTYTTMPANGVPGATTLRISRSTPSTCAPGWIPASCSGSHPATPAPSSEPVPQTAPTWTCLAIAECR